MSKTTTEKPSENVSIVAGNHTADNQAAGGQAASDQAQSRLQPHELLVLRATQGDGDALQEVCTSYARSILFRSQRIMDNRQDAEDLAQEVLIKVCTKIADLKDPRAFNGWLNSIILHESKKLITSNSKQGTVLSVTEYLDNIEEEDEDFLPMEYTLREEERKIIIAIIDRLAIRQKEAVLLHYFDGLSVTETAEVMGITQQGVSRYLKLARERVKTEMSKPAVMPRIASSQLGALPIGMLLASTLQQEAASLLSEDTLWAAQAVQKCAEYFTIAFLGSTAARSAARAAASVALAVSVFFGAWFVSSQIQAPSPSIEIPRVDAQVTQEEIRIVGLIEFTGPDSNYPEVNPTQAAAYAETDAGDMFVTEWWITALESEEVLAVGSGATIDETLIRFCTENADGEYRIYFNMYDSAGNRCWLIRSFYVQHP
ncbi:MAG: sigma-70 family RNA polymerase sigma factor [Coriobacteriia bacterium]|nr:sigma-70 family RNA polymerase sigma factor [Coriobacteriia bacterium]